jgi:hypothetical protein
MKEKFIEQLNLRASKNLTFEEVRYNDNKYFKTLKYLNNQKILKFNEIKKILDQSSLNNLPIGNILINNNQIVGFMGTFYSYKKKDDKFFLLCNIHSWIVDKRFRFNSFFLLSPLLNKDINFTAFTPVNSLVGLLSKFGFTKKTYYYKTLLNLKFFNLLKKDLFLSQNQDFIKKKISKRNLIIFDQYKNSVYSKFIIYNKNFCVLIIGSILKRKKLNVFNIFYVSDKIVFKKNWNYLKPIISKLFNCYIFSEFSLDKDDSYFPKKQFFSKMSKKRFFLKTNIELTKDDLLNSDLIV